MTVANPAVTPYVDAFRRFEKTLNGGRDGWMHNLRTEAIDRFKAQGFPTKKEETWRYTKLETLAKTAFASSMPVDAADVDRTTWSSLDPDQLGSIRLIFINGRLVAELSTPLPNGVNVTSFGAAESLPAAFEEKFGHLAPVNEDPFVALNTALFAEGAFIEIAQNIIIDQPIHLLFLSQPGETPAASHPRLLVHAKAGSSATLIETHGGSSNASYFSNSVAEVLVDAGATLDHVKFQRDSREAYHIATTRVRQGRDSGYHSHVTMLGGRLARNSLHVLLAEEGATASADGLNMMRKRGQVDSQTVIDHAVPHCTSSQLFKTILDDDATGVFDGKVIVREGAAQTSADQTNRNLLLSETAVANTKPQLEIFADDVRCTHGATVGRLDDKALFYLRSRGLGPKEAERLLTFSFAGEVLDRIRNENTRRVACNAVGEWMGADGWPEVRS